MDDLIIEGYKRGYLKSYSMAAIPKNMDPKHDDEAVVGQMQRILMRYTKSNIVLIDDNVARGLKLPRKARFSIPQLGV